MHKAVRTPEVLPAQSRGKKHYFLLLTRECRLCFSHYLLLFGRKEEKVDLQQRREAFFFSVKCQIVNILGTGVRWTLLQPTVATTGVQK